MNLFKVAGLSLIVAFCFETHPVKAQEGEYRLPLVMSVFNNATLLPGGGKLGIFGLPVHPGFSVGTEFRYNQNPKNELYQTVKLSYHYHSYVQHSLQLISEFGYRYHFKGRFDMGPRLGIGYLHSIPDMQIFELKEDGVYHKKSNWGRPQFSASFAAEVGYVLFEEKENPLRLFLAYQFYLQMPFVQEYVPLLPNTALHLGVSLPICKCKKETR